MIKNLLKVLVGLIISGVFIYFSLRGVDFQLVMENVKNFRYEFTLPIILIIVFIQFIRSIRWAVLLAPIQKINQKTLFPISCIGYMASAAIPMRIGEIVRPVLVNVKKDVPVSSALATVFIERIFDILILVLILFANLLLLPDLDKDIVNGGKIFTGIVFLAMVFMVMLVYKTEFSLKLIKPILNLFPQKISGFLENFLISFIDGFRVISSLKRTTGAFFLSAAIWLANALATYFILLFCNLDLPIIASFLILVITALGISLPAAPGFLGNFQYAAILALSYFNIQKSEAFTFSIISYLAGVGLVIMIGLIFLFFEKLSLKEILSFRNSRPES